MMDILNYNPEKLAEYLRENYSQYLFPDYNVFSQYLLFLKNYNRTIENYLEIGTGMGGQLFLTTLFLNNLKIANTVDNLFIQRRFPEEYGNQKELIDEIIKGVRGDLQVRFFESDKTEFLFNHNKKYDLIFLDANNNYFELKDDYFYALRLLNEGGLIIMRFWSKELLEEKGIPNIPGARNFWDDIDDSLKITSFNYKGERGIGIIKPK